MSDQLQNQVAKAKSEVFINKENVVQQPVLADPNLQLQQPAQVDQNQQIPQNNILEVIPMDRIHREQIAEQTIEYSSDFNKMFEQIFGMDIYQISFDVAKKTYGINGIEDLFYIDGKKAGEALRQQLSEYKKLSIDKTMAFEAAISAVMEEGKSRITVANWQENEDGFMEPVITDLNIVLKGANKNTVAKQSAKNKKDRKKHFENIQKDMEKMRKATLEKAIQSRRFGHKSNEIDRVGGAFFEAADKFMIKDDENRSDEFIAVKRALDYMYRTYEKEENSESETLLTQLAEGRFTWKPEHYKQFSILNEALTHYLAGHLNAKGKEGIIRAQAAQRLLEGIKNVSQNKAVVMEPLPVGEVNKKEKSLAETNVKRMITAYRAYSKRVGEDIIASADEKLQRRWDMLKNVERDIRIVESVRGRYMTYEEKYIVEEYYRIRAAINLREYLKDSEGIQQTFTNHRTQYIHTQMEKQMGEEKEKNEKVVHTEDGLTESQKSGVREIDQWVLRNFKNGGYMSFGLNTVDRTDITARLMSLSIRQRLYIYYMVENPTALKEPKLSDGVVSQMDYVPKIDEFKRHMIPHATKFYTRFSGGYIAWNKLTLAMSICESSTDLLNSVDALESKKPLPKPADDLPEDIRDFSEKVNELLQNLYELKEQMSGENENEIVIASPKEIQKQQAQIRKRMDALVEGQNQIKKRIQDSESKSVGTGLSGKETFVEEYAGQIANVRLMTMFTSGLADLIGSDAFTNMGNQFSFGGNQVGGLATIISQGLAIKTLVLNWSKMQDSDRGAGIAKMLLGMSDIARCGAMIGQSYGSTSKTAAQIAGPMAGAVLTGAEMIMAATTVAHNNDKKKLRKNVIKQWKQNQQGSNKEQSAEERYKNGLMRLDKLISKKESNESKSESSVAGVHMVALITSLGGFAAPLTGGLTAVLTAGGFAIAAFSKVYDSAIGKKMRQEVVGSFFNVDDMVKEAEKDWRKENGDAKLSDRQRARIREQVLYRISADLGYYSPSQLSHELAKGYGEYLISGLEQDREFAKQCKAMIKGLGLRLSYDKKTKALKTPTVSDIAKKLCA